MERILKITKSAGDYMFNNVRYYSNCAGELHRHGKDDIEFKDLPDELKTAYDRIWNGNYKNLCYLADLNGQYGIYLIREIDDDVEDPGMFRIQDVMNQIFRSFDETSVILGYEAGKDGVDKAVELIVFIPWDASTERVKEIDSVLYGEVSA